MKYAAVCFGPPPPPPPPPAGALPPELAAVMLNVRVTDAAL